MTVMRYRLRTLLIAGAIAPALIAVGWWLWQAEPVLLALYAGAIGAVAIELRGK